MDTLGNRIKSLRLNKKMTQEELGKIFGVDRSSIASWETGRREPDHEIIKRLASFFNVTTDYLLAHNDTRTPPDPNSTAIQAIEAALSDDPELAGFFEELKTRDDLQILFKQVRPLTPKAVKHIIRYIKLIEDEESMED